MRELINKLMHQIRQIWCKIKEIEDSSSGLTLGETDTTAYRGDRGKIAYDHSLSTSNPHDTTLQQVAGEGDGSITNTEIASVRNLTTAGYLYSAYSDNNTTAKWGQFVIYQEADGYLNVYSTLRTSTATASISTYYGYQALQNYPKSATSGTTQLTAYGYRGARQLTAGNNSNFFGGQVGTNIVTANGCTIIGSYSFPASTALTNHIIISDGTTTRIGFQVTDTGLTTIPLQTNAQITADSTGKSVITKEFLQAYTIPPIVTVPSTTTVARLTANVVSNSTTRANVAGWSITVEAGKVYKIKILGGYSTAVTTTGGSLGFVLVGAVGTIFGAIKMNIVHTNTAAPEQAIYAINTVATTAGSFATSTGVGTINVAEAIVGEIIFVCTTGGTLNVQWGSEVASSNATLLKNSILEVIEI